MGLHLQCNKVLLYIFTYCYFTILHLYILYKLLLYMSTYLQLLLYMSTYCTIVTLHVYILYNCYFTCLHIVQLLLCMSTYCTIVTLHVYILYNCYFTCLHIVQLLLYMFTYIIKLFKNKCFKLLCIFSLYPLRRVPGGHRLILYKFKLMIQ